MWAPQRGKCCSTTCAPTPRYRQWGRAACKADLVARHAGSVTGQHGFLQMLSKDHNYGLPIRKVIHHQASDVVSDTCDWRGW